MPLRIYVDPGHGGKDPGALGHGLREADVALAVALLVADHLRRCGAEVKLSRITDVTKSLEARTDEANAWKATAFVSVHCNAATNPEARGWEIWHTIHEERSLGDELAEAIAAQLKRLTPLPARGTKSRESQVRPGTDYYAVIRATRMPAVITELGFVTNPQDAEYLRSAEGKAKLAEAVARGVIQWGGLQWKDPQPPKQELTPLVLRRGSKGWPVRQLQQRLKALGHDPGPVDGIFGPLTERAVRSFQRAARITVDGIVGPVTWQALAAAERQRKEAAKTSQRKKSD